MGGLDGDNPGRWFFLLLFVLGEAFEILGEPDDDIQGIEVFGHAVSKAGCEGKQEYKAAAFDHAAETLQGGLLREKQLDAVTTNEPSRECGMARRDRMKEPVYRLVRMPSVVSRAMKRA